MVSPAPVVAEKITIGLMKSRALWTPARAASAHKHPAILLLPGSGPSGPEEMMPAKLTEDGRPHSLFEGFAAPFVQSDFNVLQLGKPGIEFFTRWNEDGNFDLATMYYDPKLYTNTPWIGLIDNAAAAVDFLRHQPSVDPKRIYILGHSEGTQVASDYAKRDPTIAGYILLGYTGQNIHKVLEWQFIRRPIEHFVATDVDVNHDGLVTRAEAARWPPDGRAGGLAFAYPWKPGQEQITYADIETVQRETLKIDEKLASVKAMALYKDVFDRPDLYGETAAIGAPLYIFTGAVDLQTVPTEAIALKRACDNVGKKNCYLKLIPGVGHGFSRPRAPRRHPLGDLTLGPVGSGLTTELTKLARRLNANGK
jgi:pimeloyl-ACP methyl ester carboxylesterase